MFLFMSSHCHARLYYALLNMIFMSFVLRKKYSPIIKYLCNFFHCQNVSIETCCRWLLKWFSRLYLMLLDKFIEVFNECCRYNDSKMFIFIRIYIIFCIIHLFFYILSATDVYQYRSWYHAIVVIFVLVIYHLRTNIGIHVIH